MKAEELQDVILEKWTFVIDFGARSTSSLDAKSIERTAETTCRGFDALIQQLPLSSLVRKEKSEIRLRQQIFLNYPEDPEVPVIEPVKKEKHFVFSCNEGTFHLDLTFTALDFSDPNTLENLFATAEDEASAEEPPSAVAFPDSARPPQPANGPSPHSMVDPTVLNHAIPESLTTDSCARLIHPSIPSEEMTKTMSQEDWFTFLQSYSP